MTKLNLSFDATLPEDSIIHGVERNVVNYYIPFQVERLDSLLRARLSQYDFQIAFLPEGDTLSRFNSWKFYRNICFRLAWELNTGMLLWSGKG